VGISAVDLAGALALGLRLCLDQTSEAHAQATLRVAGWATGSRPGPMQVSGFSDIEGTDYKVGEKLPGLSGSKYSQ